MDYLKTVRGLLAKSESLGDVPEGRACMDKAMELMAKHGVDEALAFRVNPDSDVMINKKIPFIGKFSKAKLRLYAALVKAYRGNPIIIDAKANLLHVFIYQSDFEKVEILYTLLLQQGISDLNRAEMPSWETSRKSFSSAFWDGFVVEVARRLDEANKVVAKDSAPGTALVLVDRKKAAETAMRNEYPRTRTQYRRGANSEAGYSAGKASGSRANLHGQGSVSHFHQRELT